MRTVLASKRFSRRTPRTVTPPGVVVRPDPPVTDA